MKELRDVSDNLLQIYLKQTLRNVCTRPSPIQLSRPTSEKTTKYQNVAKFKAAIIVFQGRHYPLRTLERKNKTPQISLRLSLPSYVRSESYT